MHATAIAVSTRFTSFFVKLHVKSVQIRYKDLRANNYAMATVCAKVLKHHQKADGSYNVKIRVFHKKDSRWIDTIHYVTDKQLSKKMTIKDPFINRQLNKTIDDYRTQISLLGQRLQFFSCENLKDYLQQKDQDIDFIKFSNRHIQQLKLEKRTGTAANHTTVRNSLIDYFRRESVSIMEINSQFLASYERYLRRSRTMTRINQLGKPVTISKEGLKDAGIHNLMRDLRTLFNEARKYYNNEDLGITRVPHYPFKKYEIASPPLTKKRNINIEQIKTLMTSNTLPGSRAELGKELWILSFYLCGMNAVDLYHLNSYSGNRIEYNRSKTKGQRKDNAFISIRIPEEAYPLLEKYIGQLKLKYSTFRGLDKALSIGIRQLREITGIADLTFYWARHSFANIARNKCKISKDDIALALNHVDGGHRTTDIYIEKDWHIVDSVQAAVLSLIK